MGACISGARTDAKKVTPKDGIANGPGASGNTTL